MLCGSQLYICGSTKQKEQSRQVFELALPSLITHPYDHLHSIIHPATFPLISLLPILSSVSWCVPPSRKCPDFRWLLQASPSLSICAHFLAASRASQVVEGIFSLYVDSGLFGEQALSTASPTYSGTLDALCHGH